MEMVTKQNWIVHAYALGVLAMCWLVLAVALSGSDRRGMDAVGDAIVLFIATGCALAHVVVSSIVVRQARSTYVGLFTMTFALG